MSGSDKENVASAPNAPLGLRWRSSYWFATIVVGLGVATDLFVYASIIPVMPFQLERLGYHSVSALTGWLLCAFSAGLVLSTIPIAMFTERYNVRRSPLIAGLIVIIGSQIMLMEAPNYAVMCAARVLQGIGDSIIWVVGLALLCDSTPEQYIGKQLGFAMSGLSIGFLAGPPVGGALYSRFGFRGPFIGGIILALIDLIGRLLIIERKDALRWGFDPAAVDAPTEIIEEEKSTEGPVTPTETTQEPDEPPNTPPHISLAGVIVRLVGSPRAAVAIGLAFLYGIVYSTQEPTLSLHLQSIWGLNSSKVGLVYLAGVIPTLLSSPLSGWYADKRGVEWLSVICIALAIPWWVVMIVRRSLALFIVAYALGMFFISGLLTPITAELAAVSRSIEGVGYGHIYGTFNLAYGISTTVGPVVGGQIYTHLREGWLAINLLSASLLFVGLALSFCYMGEDPLLRKLMRRLK
ncbi:major facilitator superfamily domain-containing protein [Mycena maculata]|uniref:Major facilitator superfamily domain-containing protein n=1 Tax=Mycena maculata TaxID=230809 RepID=A0AAD7N847_9AGAR|nr:major facilitator superfamily domain-containing protein [Mycena maculata]